MAKTAEPSGRFRLNLWMTAFAIPAFAVLLGLGTWQLQRLDWKERLIAERATGRAAPPVSIADLGTDWRTKEFRRVTARGRFLHGGEMLVVSQTYRSRPGYHVITPLALDGGGAVLVDRGWVPLDRESPATRQGGQVAGPVVVDGILRAPGRPGPWTPDNDPARGTWYYADPPAMAASAGIEAVRPFLIEAGPAPNPGGFPIGGQTKFNLPNNHLQYAITWYGLAAALAGVYIAFHLKRRN